MLAKLHLFFGFLVLKLVNPLFLVLLTFILARSLEAQDLAQFLLLYAISVIVSSLSDGGARITSFASARDLGADNKELKRVYATALKLKFFYSIMVGLPFVLIVNFATSNSIPWSLALVIWGYAVTMPIGDPSWIVKRGARQISNELRTNTIEQIAVLISCTVLVLTDLLTVHSIFNVMLLCGVGRFYYAQQFFLGVPNRVPFRGLWLRTDSALVFNSVNMWATATIGMSNLFNRIPIFFGAYIFTSQEFAVFSAFYTVFLRFEMVFSAYLHSTWRRARSRLKLQQKIIQGLFFGSIASAILILVAYYFGGEMTIVYLGAEYIDESPIVLTSAVCMLFYYGYYAGRTLMTLEGAQQYATFVVCAGALLQGAIFLWLGKGSPWVLLGFPAATFAATMAFIFHNRSS